MRSCNCLVKQLLPAAVMLALPAYAANIRPGQSGSNGASARLTISVIVARVIQTPSKPQPTMNATVSYNFPAKQYQQQYELRKMPSDNLQSSNSGSAMLRTLTIVSE
jgi:hypothetical protein